MKISQTDVLDWLQDEDFDPDEKFNLEHSQKSRRSKFRTSHDDNKKQGKRQIQEERNAKRQRETIYEIE